MHHDTRRLAGALSALSMLLLLAASASAQIASPDTTYLLGGPDRWDGRFETPEGDADWHGWTAAGPTLAAGLHPDNQSWQVNWLEYVPGPFPAQYTGTIDSPPLALPHDLADLLVTLDLCANVDGAGRQAFYFWNVRSTAAEDPAELLEAPWQSNGYLYYHETPGYRRPVWSAGPHLVPDARWVQIRIGVWDLGGMFAVQAAGFPFFDNVAVAAVRLGVSSAPEAATLAVSAYPNPFNPRTTIALELPRATDVAVVIHDARGRRLLELHTGPLAAGRHELTWDGRDTTGRAAAAGVYLYSVTAAGERRTGRLVLVR